MKDWFLSGAWKKTKKSQREWFSYQKNRKQNSSAGILPAVARASCPRQSEQAITTAAETAALQGSSGNQQSQPIPRCVVVDFRERYDEKRPPYLVRIAGQATRELLCEKTRMLKIA
jgi:hypothetical protein